MNKTSIFSALMFTLVSMPRTVLVGHSVISSVSPDNSGTKAPRRAHTGSTFPPFTVDYVVVRRKQVTIATRGSDYDISYPVKSVWLVTRNKKTTINELFRQYEGKR